MGLKISRIRPWKAVDPRLTGLLDLGRNTGRQQ